MTLVSRVRRRIKGAPHIEVNTVVSPADYRIAFELGDVDLIFQNAANSPAGRKERLQVLGLLPYPLDHPDSDKCFQYVWGKYIKKMFAATDKTLNPDTMGDAQVDTLIKKSIKEFLVSKGILPAKGDFAKLRIPGDYRVLHRDFDEKFFTEPQFTLAKGNRFDVEQRFYAANPALGKIPIIARVEIRPRSGGDWKPVQDISVFFQLKKPDDLPSYSDTTNPTNVVAGALSWTDSVGGADLRRSSGKALKNSRRGNDRKQGPGGYLASYALARHKDTQFLKSPSVDPQRKNHFWKFGGKRYLGTDTAKVHETRTHNGNSIDNVFVLTPVGKFNQKYPLAVDIGDPERRVNPHAVVAKTNADGEAGVIFAPSRIGGDRYRLRAFLFTKRGEVEKASTGTMVRWRTMRIARALSVRPPADANTIDRAILNELKPYFNDCGHASKTGGRFCAECLLREGKCPDINYAEMAKELSKAYCELLIDGNAERSFHRVFDRNALKETVDEFAKKLENNEQFAGVMDLGEPFGLTDGQQKSFTGTLKAKGTIVPKHVKVKIGEETVAIDDGSGKFIETGSTSAWKAGGIDLNGTIDYGSGKLTITFAEAPPAGKEIYVGLKLKVAIDWRSLIYYAEFSPFLLNLHTPQAYNSVIDQTKFAPIASHTTGTAEIGTCNGIRDSFSITLPKGVNKPIVKADGTDISGGGKFTARVNRKTGQLDVTSVATKSETFPYKSTSGKTFSATLASAPQRASGGFLTIKIKQVTDKVKHITEIKSFGFVRNDMQPVINFTPQERATFKYNQVTKQIQIDLVGDTSDIEGFIIEYSGKTALDKIKLTVDYEADAIYDNTNPKPLGNGPSAPDSSFIAHVNTAINWYFLVYVVRKIEDNRGFMPGLIMIRSPLRDTWSSVWDSKGMHQGKGVCNGFFLFYGNQWRATGYDTALEIGDGTKPQIGLYPSLLLHEMSHCLYVNHFPSGVPMASGARADQHDMYDTCLMGYGAHDNDYCGQCVAGFMGINTADPCLMTWKGARMLKTDSSINSYDEEKQDKTKIRHVEPPEIAEPAGHSDGDDVMSLLESCPFAKQVYDDAVVANGGIPPKIVPAENGRGSCDHVNGDIGYPMTDRILLKDGEQPLPGAVERVTALGVRTQELTGPDIGVQIFIMELSNLKHRYDFFDHDAEMQRGRMGRNAFIRATERVEYDGGVRNVIQAYDQCNTQWKARICTKEEAKPYMNDFDKYFDQYLDPTHKQSYSEVWYTKGARSWYFLRVPGMKNYSSSQMDSIISNIVVNKFSKQYKLDSDDNASWKLLNILFAIDADFDSGNSAAMTWVEETLKKAPPNDSAMDKVRYVYKSAQLKYRDKKIPAVG